MTDQRELALQYYRATFHIWDSSGPLARLVNTLADITVKAHQRGEMTHDLIDLAARTYYEVHYPERETWDKRLARHNHDDLDILDTCHFAAVTAAMDAALLLSMLP